jgi:murein DD-endopeptidase MepM/ murein hydrolase activator NlpD
MAEAITQSYAEFYNAALRIVCRDLREMNTPLISTIRGRSALSWQEAASMYTTFGEDMAGCIARGLLLDLVLTTEGAAFTCAFSDNETLFSQGTRDQLYTARSALAYLYTVYTDEGEPEPYQTPTLDPDYLATLTHPLPGCTIKNGWYNARDRKTRLHTGTDILANRGTKILSVTDGEVLYIGFSRLPGYYVIIRDSFGYEYHYYHMVALSDLVEEGDMVEPGQPIGLVGSTGNSAANHLHLGIITPEGNYLNPYDVFVQAGIGPIRPDN